MRNKATPGCLYTTDTWPFLSKLEAKATISSGSVSIVLASLPLLDLLHTMTHCGRTSCYTSTHRSIAILGNNSHMQVEEGICLMGAEKRKGRGEKVQGTG